MWFKKLERYFSNFLAFFTVNLLSKRNGILFPDVYLVICGFKTLGKKKPPISRRVRMCSVAVSLAPPLGLEPRTL